MTFLKSWTFWIPTLVPQGLLCLGTWLTHLITVFPTCEVSAISMQRALPLACTHALWESCLQQGSLPLSLLMSLLHCLPHWLLHPHVGLYRFQLILERLLCSGHEVLRSLVQFSSAGTVSRPSIWGSCDPTKVPVPVSFPVLFGNPAVLYVLAFVLVYSSASYQLLTFKISLVFKMIFKPELLHSISNTGSSIS